MLFVFISVCALIIALICGKKISTEKFRQIVIAVVIFLIVGAIATISFEIYFNGNYLKVAGYTYPDEEGYSLCRFVNLYTDINSGKYYIVKENVLGVRYFVEVEALNNGEFYAVADGDRIPMTQYGPAYRIKPESD